MNTLQLSYLYSSTHIGDHNMHVSVWPSYFLEWFQSFSSFWYLWTLRAIGSKVGLPGFEVLS